MQSHIQHAKLRVERLRAKMEAAVPATPDVATSGAEGAFVAGNVTGAPEGDFLERARSFEQAGKYEDAMDCLDHSIGEGIREGRGLVYPWLLPPAARRA